MSSLPLAFAAWALPLAAPFTFRTATMATMAAATLLLPPPPMVRHQRRHTAVRLPLPLPAVVMRPVARYSPTRTLAICRTTALG